MNKLANRFKVEQKAKMGGPQSRGDGFKVIDCTIKKQSFVALENFLESNKMNKSTVL